MVGEPASVVESADRSCGATSLSGDSARLNPAMWQDTPMSCLDDLKARDTWVAAIAPVDDDITIVDAGDRSLPPRWLLLALWTRSGHSPYHRKRSSRRAV